MPIPTNCSLPVLVAWNLHVLGLLFDIFALPRPEPWKRCWKNLCLMLSWWPGVGCSDVQAKLIDPNEYISSIQRLCSFNSRSLAFHWLHSMPEFASSTCQGIVNWISMQLPLQKGRTKSSRRLVEWGNEITKRIQNSVPYSFTSFCLAERSPFFFWKLLEVLFLLICWFAFQTWWTFVLRLARIQPAPQEEKKKHKKKDKKKDNSNWPKAVVMVNFQVQIWVVVEWYIRFSQWSASFTRYSWAGCSASANSCVLFCHCRWCGCVSKGEDAKLSKTMIGYW